MAIQSKAGLVGGISKPFTKISINLSSPDTILAQSFGEVTKPETINYRSFKPEKDGLFCEKIFGPVRDWECHCGKYKRIRYKGIICDRCGVEITMKSVRRERMGHIQLATPVVHLWYFRSLPSKTGYILGMSVKDLERIIYYESYVVIAPGSTGLKSQSLISEEEYFRIITEFPEEKTKATKEDEDKFVAKIGGEAIKEMLKRIDLNVLSKKLRAQFKIETSVQRKTDILKRLKVIEPFKIEGTENINKPDWMVLDVIPVIPPELRPLVPLEGGRFATSDLNDLYRRVIIRNSRLKNLMEIRAPEVILRNEKRMLQEAVDSLFDNGKKATAVRNDGNRPLKSLSDMLKGKQGRFRQNLLGKRVDYSGRSVIVVGPELNLHQCGLPKDMAVELFKPFIIRKLVERGLVKTVKSAKKMVDKKGKEIWDILELIIKDHPVMLNRAPTLHRLGIQAFQPVLIEGKAIRVHPLVCAAFNADFDGDQMAVHVPLSYEAQIETRMLMLSSHNILSPANGRPIAVPSQDIVLGCYYLTKIRKGDKGEGMNFANQKEVIIALNSDKLGLHAEINVRIDGNLIKTTTGRVLFNQIVPEGLSFINEMLTKGGVEKIVYQSFRQLGNMVTAEFLDRLKEVGFYYAMKGGISIGIDDVIIPEIKEVMIKDAAEEVAKIQKRYERGIITDGERYNKIIDIWTHTTADVSRAMFDGLSTSQNGFNPVYIMADSGARGSREQIRQLAGMRGLMAKPQKSMTGQTGEIIESPITANFREGLSVLEYFISTHGARKGLADTALKTADAGYLTRRLVDVAQDVIISEDDCGTILGIEISALKEGEEVIEPLAERILGRVTVDDVYVSPRTDELLIGANEMIDEEVAKKISDTIIETVKIRSVLTCESSYGVCRLCYGRNMATCRLVNIGEAVGVMGAQSIGEPGTQLTLRTFHIGGTAQVGASQSEIKAKYAGIIVFSDNLRFAEREMTPDQKIAIALGRNGRIDIIDENNRVVAKYNIPYGATLLVFPGDTVEKNQIVFRWDPYSEVIVSEFDGVTSFSDIKNDITVKEELDEHTGMRQRIIIEFRNKITRDFIATKLNPAITIKDENGDKLANYIVPTSARLIVNDGDQVKSGDILVKIPRSLLKSKDITGGLPRVAELFEARKPKEPAVVSEIDGVAKFGSIKRGVREIIVEGESAKKSYLIPYGKHVLVHDNDTVEAGERLSEGSITPHDILRIKSASAVQEYLVNEIQEVYRLQGVRINDKHIEVIVRQMLQRVKIEDPGDTNYLEGDLLDKSKFIAANEKISDFGVVEKPGDSKLEIDEMVELFELDRLNERLEKQEKTKIKFRKASPATFVAQLLGITQASLSTESFISSASFQETTRVLTEAAIQGKVDNLRGLKENVIMGHLIPAGTGIKEWKSISIESDVVKEETEKAEEAVEMEEAKEGVEVLDSGK